MKADLVQSEKGEVIRWVTFQLAKETYGINVTQVREVLRFTEIAPVPGAPHYVLGIINLRGNVVTVIDTRNRFGLESKEIDDSSRIVIIEVDGQEVGILVDSVAEVVDLAVADIEPAPNVGNEDAARYIQGVTSLEGQLLILVDLNRLLSEEELQEVTSY
ncbi:MAG: chemotaxis protein CheW [Gammaproteobacteria bacterium]|nr:chemotaxis protein CheW [Gammaproteobacteria bacterium]MDH5730194.1 chemotaxis protein CheW [Gammaproteobacteria bacterium]